MAFLDTSSSSSIGSTSSGQVRRKPQNSTNLSWQFIRLTRPNNHNDIKCKKCDNTFKGETIISREKIGVQIFMNIYIDHNMVNMIYLYLDDNQVGVQ